ncbi:hypothetical protein PGTUg99_004807 [Puccinia graminis f. sp. tritici]|uniref:Helicase ATP-binding domain-containing protein n=1 Tax=Puccinia graminis f. sp. tritici TaxID=56615 RepID=A0A5B0QKD7_PUCGR|nr:hypothetical protein PGTUg99_004807 [Puccinia graminis f. sp. tritici]
MNSSAQVLRDAVFHRGRHNIHVLCSNYENVGDLSERQSGFLGPLIGDVGSVSEPLTKKSIEQNQKKLYLRLFYLNIPTENTSFVHGFVFSPSQCVSTVRQAFHSANLALKHIPNYQSNHFFGVPQCEDSSNHISVDNCRQVPGCKTKLMDHQLQAVSFIRRSESKLVSIPHEIWNHPNNRWAKRVYEDAVRTGNLDDTIDFGGKGCILADDMGLGKTLTTLSAIQLSATEALKFSERRPDEQSTMRSSATLIICPLSTLENWKNEINIHFGNNLPFIVYYGKEKSGIEFKNISQVAVVLATYESVTIASRGGNSQELQGRSKDIKGRGMGLDLSNIEWFRIVLDEAHYMKDPKTNRSITLLGLKSQQRLCLTRTPLQNQLGDLHNLIKFLRIEPWTNNSIWKQCVEIPVQRCEPRGISTLQNLMSGVSMRRLKTTILALPKKVETIVNLKLHSPWNEIYERNHQAFSEQFGKNRVTGQGWNSGEFFGELVDLRQLCNHPALIDKQPGRKKYFWNESSKIGHLVDDLLAFLRSGLEHRAVIFSEFKRFLEM